MRIAFIHYTMPDTEMGGVETVIREQALFLLEKKHKITFIFGRGGGLHKKIKDICIPELHGSHPDIAVIQSEIYKPTKDKTKFKEEFDHIKNLLKEKIKNALIDIDICIVHNISTMPLNFPATIAINELTQELKEPKFIYWMHDSIVFREEWASYIDRWPFTELHYKSDKIRFVTITGFRKKQFSDLTNHFKIDNLQVIPNGINVEDYLKLDELTLLLKDVLEINWEDLVLLMPIRITPRKNIELGFRILAELKKLFVTTRICDDIHPTQTIYTKVKLLVSGPPDNQAIVEGLQYLEYLRKLAGELGIREDVLLLSELIAFNREYKEGQLYKFSVADAYALADVVLVTSKEEGFGLPLIEASAARKPIFCARIPPFQELLRDGIDCNMFDLSDPPENIAYRIFKFFLHNIIEHGFTRVLRSYSWKEILEHKLLPLLTELHSSH